MSIPTYTYFDVQDASSSLTAATWHQLQTNIINYVGQFVPLSGATLTGPLTFPANQIFASGQVNVKDPSYPHIGYWVTLNDHINDASVHAQVAAPLAHAPSHMLGGSDPLYGDGVGISLNYPSTTIKAYIDSQVASATAASTNYAPASQYSAGGATPLYGNVIAISSALPTTDVKTYVDSSISTAISNGGSSSPTYTSVSLSGTASSVNFTGGPANLIAQGSSFLTTDGTNLALLAKSVSGAIRIGNQSSSTAYGVFSAAGYSIGSSIFGPTATVVNGTVTTNNDLVITRTTQGVPLGANIYFGGSSGGSLSYNLTNNNQFSFSSGVAISGPLTLATGNAFTITGSLQIGTTTSSTISPALTPDASGNITLGALEGQNISLGGLNTNLGKINLGPAAAWGYHNATGFNIGTTQVNGTASTFGGTVTVNGARADYAGDIGIARTTTSGCLWFGSGSGASSFSYGSGAFSFSTAGSGLSSVNSDGSYNVGSSNYGPISALVNGTVTANKAMYAQTGITFGGANGYTFTGITTGDTGMYSIGSGDLRFYTAAKPALLFSNQGSQATFYGNVAAPNGAITSATLTTTGNVVAGANLTITNTLYAANTSITKFRVRNNVALGNFSTSAASTAAVFPNIPMPAFANGQIENLRITVLTADGGSTATTATIYKNGSVIGTVALTNGATSSSNYPVVNPTPLVTGDILTAKISQAGTATGVSIFAEISQTLY